MTQIATAQITPSSEAWSTWSPTWANFTVGNGTVTARYKQIGKTVHVYLKFVAGSTSAFGTNPTFTLPVTAASQFSAQVNSLGINYAEDLATNGYSFGYVLSASTTVCTIDVVPVNGTYLNIANGVTSTVPWTLGAGDFFTATFTYEAA